MGVSDVRECRATTIETGIDEYGWTYTRNVNGWADLWRALIRRSDRRLLRRVRRRDVRGVVS